MRTFLLADMRNHSFLNGVWFNRSPMVMISGLSLPFGYLLAPSTVTPLWLLLFLLIFFTNLKSLRLGILEILIFVAFPAYAVSLALVSNRSESFPLSHCLAISVSLIVYVVGKYLFSLINYRFTVAILATSYWILALIVAFEVFVNATGFDASVPEFVRITGFSNYSSLKRVSGFWLEPGHLGVAINFLFPFAILTQALSSCNSSPASGLRLVSKAFYSFAFLVALLCSLATLSSPTFLITLIQGILLFNPAATIAIVAVLFAPLRLNVLSMLFRNRSSAFMAIAFLFGLMGVAYYAFNDVKIASIFSYLFQADAGDRIDILSAGDRATRIHWAIGRIQEVPWGHGIAPYYRSGASTVFSDTTALELASGETGYESSLSTPLDFALWAGPLWPILIFLFIYRRVGRSLFHIASRSQSGKANDCAESSSNSNVAFYCFVAMVAVVLAMLVRFCFIGNYYYPFLFLSVALASKTYPLLLLLFSGESLGNSRLRFA